MDNFLNSAFWSVAGGSIVAIIASILKRFENKPAQDLERDKVEYEQNLQMRAEMRAQLKDYETRVSNMETRISELERKNIELERENARKDIKLEAQASEIARLRAELDKFERKVFYIAKETDKPKEGE